MTEPRAMLARALLTFPLFFACSCASPTASASTAPTPANLRKELGREADHARCFPDGRRVLAWDFELTFSELAPRRMRYVAIVDAKSRVLATQLVPQDHALARLLERLLDPQTPFEECSALLELFCERRYHR